MSRSATHEELLNADDNDYTKDIFENDVASSVAETTNPTSGQTKLSHHPNGNSLSVVLPVRDQFRLFARKYELLRCT